MSNIKNSNLKLLEHQEEAYNDVIKLFEEKGKAAVIFPTGCGKSFVTLKYILEHPDERILFLSPRNAIKDQMYEYVIRFIGGDFRSIEEIQKENILENNASAALRKAAKKYIPNIECMLYQTILRYGEKRSSDRVLKKLKPDIIIVDEMHHLKTKSLNNTGKRNVILDEESDEKEKEYEQQNKWGERFHRFLEDNPQAKLLGLSATPIRNDGINVVEKIFEDSVASELSLLRAIELDIIFPPKYVVPDFIEKDELESLLQKIEQANDNEKEELKEKYDELVKKSSNAPGIPELMQEHIEEKNGKYIIFCKDIKDMQEKMSQAKEWFSEIDEEPEVYGIHSKDKDSANKLEQFKTSNSSHLKLMYCVGMIDEGMHLGDISGVILAAKTGSRATYLQRIGRGISSGKDKKQALVIDLVNNNEILYDSKVQPGYEVNDLELLQELVEWIEKNNGELPNFDEAPNLKEKAFAKRFARINNKYLKYVENEELLNELDDYKKQQIIEIIEHGKTIGMFDDIINLKLSDEEKERTVLIDSFLGELEIKGIRKDFRDILTQCTSMSISLKNALEIEKWCQNTFKDKKIWERRLPADGKNVDENERLLAIELSTIRQNILSEYEGKKLNEIRNPQHRKIAEIIRRLDLEYGNTFIKNALRIENWCEENFKDKEIWERRLPSRGKRAQDETEKKLAQLMANIKTAVVNQYEGKELEEIENEAHRIIVKIIRKLDSEYGQSVLLKNTLEIKDWCEKNFKDKEIWERRLPSRDKKADENEKKLAISLVAIRQKVLSQYKGKKLEEIPNKDDHRIIVEIIRKLDIEYGDVHFKNASEIENWCKINLEKTGERRLPNQLKYKDENEKRLVYALSTVRKLVNKYKGKKLEEIPNEAHRRTTEIIRRIDIEYGNGYFKNALEIENWCKMNFEKTEERRLPSKRNDSDETERKLAEALAKIRTKISKKYEGIELEKIQDEAHRRITEIIRRIDEAYNPIIIKQRELANEKERYLMAIQKNKEAKALESQVKEQIEKKEIKYGKQPNAAL